MANPKNILNKSFPTNILKGLNKQRSSSSFCDITLQIQDQRFSAHRCVLVSASKYFENMLKAERKYVESQAETVNLKEVNSNAFAILLNYIYAGVLSIDSSNAGQVFKLADYLQLKWPKNECSKYLVDSLTPENAVGIWEYGRECFCDELQNEANKSILTNLKSILNTDEFKNLDLEKLEEIFQHNEMPSTPADDVFIAIIEWVKHDLPNRKRCFIALSKYIQGGSISDDLLKSNIPKEAFLREDVSITNWMLDNVFISRIKENSYNVPQEPVNTNIFISALANNSNCYKYDTKVKESTLIKKPSICLYYPVHYKHDIYFTCGLVNGAYKKVCPKYNIETETWTEIQFESDRYWHGGCVLNDKMYIVGGVGARGVFRNDVKAYDFEIGELISLQSKMNEARTLFGIAVQNGSIYTCGGCGCNFEDLNSVERFDPREGKWVSVPDMNELSGWCTSAFVSDELYCSARFKGIIKKFDIRMNSWEGISNLPSRKDNCLVTNQGDLYAVTPKHIYQYNRNGNSWNQIYSTLIYSLNDLVIATSY